MSKVFPLDELPKAIEAAGRKDDAIKIQVQA